MTGTAPTLPETAAGPGTDSTGSLRTGGRAGTVAIGEAVERLATAGATGALRSGVGTVYLAEGSVVHVESDRATGLATVLTACGLVPPATWLETVRAFGPGQQVARMLVARGRLTQGALQLCHLDALYDAAFFVLSGPAAPASFAPVSLCIRDRHETVRRRELLERIWPCPQLDVSPVRPRPADAGTRQRIGPHRRRLLELADGRRTPVDIARLLGRSTFATTVEIRHLAANGLIETPPARRPPVESPHAEIPQVEIPHADTADTDVAEAEAAGEARRAARAAPGPVRRIPGETLSHTRRPRHAAARPLSVHDPDVALLTRVLTALEDRL